MWVVFKKEIRSFLGSFIAYIVMGVFLIITGIFMWIIQENNVLDLGIASLQVMFNIAPYILIFLVSAITMRSLSEERRLGTIEILTTRPVSDTSILLGKYLAAVGLIVSRCCLRCFTTTPFVSWPIRYKALITAPHGDRIWG